MLTTLRLICVCLFLVLAFPATSVNEEVLARGRTVDDLDNIVFEGVVRDLTGAVIPSARVVIRKTDTGLERVIETDSEGRYRTIRFEPGDYTVKASATGFQEEEYEYLHTISGRRVITDFSLNPAGAQMQMEVQATSASRLDITRTVAGDTLGTREIDELPLLNRDPIQLVFLIGGTVEAPLTTDNLADEGAGRFFRGTPEEAGVFSLTGGQSTSNNLTIDGLDNNDDRAARERIALSPESVAEVQVITNQYAAEYGRASGGRINLRTRGGTNEYHGDVYAHFGDESLNANTFYRNARGLGRIPQQQRRESGAFSGPIKRDRFFFFASCERLDITDFATINATVPVRQNPLFPLPPPNLPVAPQSEFGSLLDEISTPETRNLSNARADLTFGSNHNATIRFDDSRGVNKRGFSGGSRLADTILSQGRDSDSISVTDNLIVSPQLVNQSRFQFSRLLPRNSATDLGIGAVIKDPALTAGGFSGSDSAPAFSRRERRWQFQDSLTVIRGQHATKTGADIQIVNSSFTDLFATGGIFTFENVQDFLANTPSRYQQRFNTESKASNKVFGFFVQDEWRARPGLTVSTGLRWDNESILSDHDNISPRIAIAWDPFSGINRTGLAAPGKTVVRAGFGLFYNRVLLRTIDDFSLGKSSVLVDSDINPDLLNLVTFPKPIVSARLIDQFGINETQFLRRVSSSLQIPYTMQSGMGIERELTRKTVFTADYIFTRGLHLWRESNVNAPVLPKGFDDLTEYLLSRDFDNRLSPDGKRPISGTSADVVRFELSTATSSTAGAIRVVNGVRILTLGLNAPRSSNISAALNAVRSLRPDPSLTQVELLESTGNSFYHAGIFSVRWEPGEFARLRAVYTISKFIDEGTTNTASPQDLLDRRTERGLSLQDQRHRFVLSGAFRVPGALIDFAPVVSIGSSKPFNIGSGFDRNLNDIPNDRPIFIAPIGRPAWRRPGSEGDSVRDLLRLATIGSNGNLPRNYGRGPGTRTFDLRVSRNFTPREGLKIRPAIDFFNVLNMTVFSFGSEFIDRDDATFLVPQRTQRPRTILLNLKITI